MMAGKAKAKTFQQWLKHEGRGNTYRNNMANVERYEKYLYAFDALQGVIEARVVPIGDDVTK